MLICDELHFIYPLLVNLIQFLSHSELLNHTHDSCMRDNRSHALLSEHYKQMCFSATNALKHSNKCHFCNSFLTNESFLRHFLSDMNKEIDAGTYTSSCQETCDYTMSPV